MNNSMNMGMIPLPESQNDEETYSVALADLKIRPLKFDYLIMNTRISHNRLLLAIKRNLENLDETHLSRLVIQVTLHSTAEQFYMRANSKNGITLYDISLEELNQLSPPTIPGNSPVSTTLPSLSANSSFSPAPLGSMNGNSMQSNGINSFPSAPSNSKPFANAFSGESPLLNNTSGVSNMGNATSIGAPNNFHSMPVKKGWRIPGFKFNFNLEGIFTRKKKSNNPFQLN